eukprot:COSAG02_NODE_7176_length_3137_cov_1.480579_3_plen_152_part_00
MWQSAPQWREDEEALTRWKQGNTGMPLVDANMRELAATGWMSNRGRQNVASYLILDLGIDCDWQLTLLTLNITLSIITVLLVVVSAWLAMRDSEKIQEEEDEADKAEKERVKTVMAVMRSRSKSVARRNSKFSSSSFQSTSSRNSSDEGSR